MNARELYSAVSWHVRGVFAEERLREVGFAARDLAQRREVVARIAMARELLRGSPPAIAIDRANGYVKLGARAELDAVATAGSAVAGNAESGETPPGKEFFRTRFSTDDELVTLLRAALAPELVAAVTAYLGVVPVIAYADYYCSVPHGPPWNKSQLWHCDDDGARIVKLFVYCEDVGPDNGPFEFVAAGDSARARKAVGYRYAGRRYRVSDAAMDAHVPRDRQLAIEGPRTTGFLIDTTHCFHRGSRIAVKNKRRVAAIVCYCQPSAVKLPLRLAGSRAPLAKYAPRFAGELERAVLGVPVA